MSKRIKELQKKWRKIGSSPTYFMGQYFNDDLKENNDDYSGSVDEAHQKCTDFFNRLIDILGDEYVSISSCNQDFSRYLCLKGTDNEITYSSKPDISFRISDHWNWYSNIKKCPNPYYIQCHSADAPWPRKRDGYGKASKPWKICQVCVFVNGMYRAVYGECYDAKTRKTFWLGTEPEAVALLTKNGSWDKIFPTNKMLYERSKKIIEKAPGATFEEAYDLSYSDIYSFEEMAHA